ncbi:MAG: EB domain-containing protein [Archangium sp.]
MRRLLVAAWITAALSCVPTRECGEGTVLIGNTCVAQAVDLCAANPCVGLVHSVCEQDEQGARCRCPETLVEVNGACVPPSACAPNPCTAPRDTCLLVDGAANCECASAFTFELDGGCSDFPAWDCTAQHEDGDPAEPDECPALAPTGGLNVHFMRTLAPAGDRDWLRLQVPPGHIVELSVLFATGGDVSLEVFEETPLRRAGFSSGHTPTVRTATAGNELLVQVRAVSAASPVTSYELLAVDRGVDDFPNDASQTVTVGQTVQGQLQYPTDVDVFRLSFEPHVATSIVLRGAAMLELSRGTQSVAVTPGQKVTVAYAQETQLLARVRGDGTVSDFTVELTQLGSDDACDTPALSEELRPGVVFDGRIDRDADLDSFTIPQEPAHLYLPTVNGPTQLRVVSELNQVLSFVGSGLQDSPVWKGSADGAPVTLTISPTASSGTYSVVVTDLGFDDHSNTAAGATPLPLGDLATGNLELSSDVDTFAVEVQQGHAYGIGAQTQFAAPTIRVLDSFGLVQQQDNQTTSTAFTAQRTGTQWVQVLSSTRRFDSFTLRVLDLGADDHGDSSVDATPLGVGGSVHGVVVPNDVDAFSFTAQARNVYRVALTSNDSSANFQLAAVDASGAPIATGFGRRVTFTAQPGVVTVLISEVRRQAAAYDVSLSVLGVDQHGDDTTSATPITPGQVVDVVADWEGDFDVLAVPVVANHAYDVVTGAGQVSLVIDGNMMESNFRAASNGTAYVLWSDQSGMSVATTVRVDDLGVDDHGDVDSMATAFTGTVSGVIQFPADRDVFRAPTLPGHFYRVLVPGAAVVVASSNGTAIGGGFLGDGNDVFIRVNGGQGVLRYTVQLIDTGVDDHGDTRATATVLATGVTVSGFAQLSSDIDVFAIDSLGAQIFEVEVVSPEPVLFTLKDPADLTLASTSVLNAKFGFRGASRFLATVNANGVVPYDITARLVTDDFDEAVPATLVSGVQRTGRLEFTEDRDVFTFSATAGQQVTLNVSGQGALSYFVRGPMGMGLPSSFQAAVTGTYTVEIVAVGARVSTYDLLLTLQ